MLWEMSLQKCRDFIDKYYSFSIFSIKACLIFYIATHWSYWPVFYEMSSWSWPCAFSYCSSKNSLFFPCPEKSASPVTSPSERVGMELVQNQPKIFIQNDQVVTELLGKSPRSVLNFSTC